jgi:type III secretion system YscI/HrpB-like protein
MAAEIVSLVAQATESAGWVDTPVLRSVSDSDAARLADLLSTQAVQAAQSAAPAAMADLRAASNSIGDAILRTMDTAGRDFQAKTAEIERLLGAPHASFTAGDILRLQNQLITSSLQVEVLSKVVSKAVQHIDQLTKLQ